MRKLADERREEKSARDLIQGELIATQLMPDEELEIFVLTVDELGTSDTVATQHTPQ